MGKPGENGDFYGKITMLLMGKSVRTFYDTMFNSYFDLTRGYDDLWPCYPKIMGLLKKQTHSCGGSPCSRTNIISILHVRLE